MNNATGLESDRITASIMVVEDESIVAKDIESSLGRLGYTVCALASTGDEAIAAACQHRPDLILMDIMLKGKTDGVEAARQISSLLATPIVFLTAYSDESTIRRAKQVNAYGYLLKPFEERELRTTIEMALYKSVMERRLQQNREWLETILNCIADGVLTTNADGRVEFCNPVAERLTGWAADEMRLRNLSEVVCLKGERGDEAVEIDFQQIMRNGPAMVEQRNCILIARDGAQAKVEVIAVPLRHSNGQVTGIVIVLRDIAARNEAEERERALQMRLHRAQRMESLGVLANGVAEQLQRILGPIVEYPPLIANKISAGNDVGGDLDMVRNSAEKATAILGDLIKLGQMREFVMEPLALDAIVDEYVASTAFNMQRRKFPLVQFELIKKEQIPLISGSAEHLREMLANIVAASFAAVSGSGTVRIELESAHAAETVHGFEIIEPGDYAVLKIADSGPVLGESDLNRLFEPFAGRSAAGPAMKGNGLEMAVAYAIIKGHKGMVDIRPAGAGGNEIAVYFAVCRAAAKCTAPAVAEIGLGGMETILVVDDDPDIRKTTCGYLRAIGYKVEAAQNGAEAVEIIRRTKQEGTRKIDLVMLDMIMADGFDGLDTYQAILKIEPLQKAILVSGFSMTDRMREAMRLGARNCLLKPYENNELARVVRATLDKPQEEQRRDA